MYELPSMENACKVVVDESVIKGESKPIIIYETPQNQVASE